MESSPAAASSFPFSPVAAAATPSPPVPRSASLKDRFEEMLNMSPQLLFITYLKQQAPNVETAQRFHTRLRMEIDRIRELIAKNVKWNEVKLLLEVSKELCRFERRLFPTQWDLRLSLPESMKNKNQIEVSFTLDQVAVVQSSGLSTIGEFIVSFILDNCIHSPFHGAYELYRDLLDITIQEKTNGKWSIKWIVSKEKDVINADLDAERRKRDEETVPSKRAAKVMAKEKKWHKSQAQLREPMKKKKKKMKNKKNGQKKLRTLQKPKKEEEPERKEVEVYASPSTSTSTASPIEAQVSKRRASLLRNRLPHKPSDNGHRRQPDVHNAEPIGRVTLKRRHVGSERTAEYVHSATTSPSGSPTLRYPTHLPHQSFISRNGANAESTEGESSPIRFRLWKNLLSDEKSPRLITEDDDCFSEFSACSETRKESTIAAELVHAKPSTSTAPNSDDFTTVDRVPEKRELVWRADDPVIRNEVHFDRSSLLTEDVSGEDEYDTDYVPSALSPRQCTVPSMVGISLSDYDYGEMSWPGDQSVLADFAHSSASRITTNRNERTEADQVAQSATSRVVSIGVGPGEINAERIGEEDSDASDDIQNGSLDSTPHNRKQSPTLVPSALVQTKKAIRSTKFKRT